MLLVSDIGNTSIALAVFENQNIVKKYRFPSDKNLSISNYATLLRDISKEYDISSCVIASVVTELNEVFADSIKKVFNINPIMLTHTSNLGLQLKVKQPETVGADRIANVCIAKRMYTTPVIVVDIGTAVTFDILDKNGDFIGGIIMPGINLQFKSLASTSKLPMLEMNVSEKAIGDDTETCIYSGIIRGMASAIDGLIKECEEELGEKATVVATGGNSFFISKYMERQFDQIDPDLTLKGLMVVNELNSLVKA